MKLLDNILVLECSSNFTASNVGVRLSQLGANVVRVINTEQGDALSRESLYGQFHAEKSILSYSKSIGKSELLIDPKSESEIALFRENLAKADVVIFDYNSNVFAGLGVNRDTLREEFPHLIVAEFSDYGSHTLYKDRVGDDLLIQAFSGITWLTGNRDDTPTTMGFKVASQFCSSYLIQGIMAALYRREVSAGVGSKVSTSLLEAAVLVQFEVVTTAASRGMIMPQRTKRGNAHASLPAPYGVYRSKDGFFAMSLVAMTLLADILDIELPAKWLERESWLLDRDDIMEFLEPYFLQKTNKEWMDIFTPHDIWCSDINDLCAALDLEAYKILDLEAEHDLPMGKKISTIKPPYQIITSPCHEAPRPKREVEHPHHPYDGLLVLDISQYLSGPTSTLLLADFGATVVKIERPNVGDMGRNMILSNVIMDDASSSFLSISRNKRSAALNLKDEADWERVKKLMGQADVIVHNFRPSVMTRLKLDYESIREINPSVIYTEISGYGDTGCWVGKPGQDYIVQALSGLCLLSGQYDQEPVPNGLSVVDTITGCYTDEAIAAAIYNREKRNEGALIKVTMLGSVMDLQTDFITAHRWDSNEGLLRTSVANAHSGEDAPYGIYKTKNGALALSAAPLESIIEMPVIDPNLSWRERQNVIKASVAQAMQCDTTENWIERLSNLPNAKYGEILNWQQLFGSQQGVSLKMLQTVKRGTGFNYTTTRCPVRFDDHLMIYDLGAPLLGEHTQYVIKKYNL